MSSTRLLGCLLAALTCCCLVALPGSASAARGEPKFAKFSATFTAERTVDWSQERGVSLIDCMGSHFYEAGGSETWSMKTRKPQKVTVMGGLGKDIALWSFGTWSMSKPTGNIGIDVHGVRTRSFRESMGTTGGWCKPGYNVVPQDKGDCGTRLPEHNVRFSTLGGALVWSVTSAPHMRREKLGFDKCVLVAPSELGGDDFPVGSAKLPLSRVFKKKRKKIVLKGEKVYEPETVIVPNYGKPRTTRAKVTWKLVLKRK